MRHDLPQPKQRALVLFETVQTHIQKQRREKIPRRDGPMPIFGAMFDDDGFREHTRVFHAVRIVDGDAVQQRQGVGAAGAAQVPGIEDHGARVSRARRIDHGADFGS